MAAIGVRTRLDRAAAGHREAAAVAAAAGRTLAGYGPRTRAATEERSIRELAERLRVAAALLAPGWLGAPLDALPASTPLDQAALPAVVRVGTAYPLDDASFPVVLPLGHLAFDGDARDPRVAGTLRALLLRLLATAPAGSLRVLPVDPAAVAFTRFAPLHGTGIMPPPVADRPGLQAVLTEAEQWVRAGRDPARTLLLAIASWPQATEQAELARLSALAAAGPDAGLHLLVAGWPPPPLGDDRPAPSLPHATQVTLRNPYALVGHPPGGSFGSSVPPGQTGSAGLNAQVYLDESPPADLIARICTDLAGRRPGGATGDLLPDGPLWMEDGTAGLQVPVGRAGGAPVTVRLAGATPHWLIVGGPGSGKTSFLLAVLYGLSTRYSPAQLDAYLLDLTGAGRFADFVPSATDPSQLPHARAVAVAPSPEEARAILRALAGRAARRAETGQSAPRLVCLIDGVDQLPDGEPAAGLLAAIAQSGGRHGVHLVLAGRALPPEPVATQCRIRIALPGGAAALDPANQAAADLAPGTAVVNTAGGLGGPRGATRAHEQLVHFPDPDADRPALVGLRHRLWREGGGRP